MKLLYIILIFISYNQFQCLAQEDKKCDDYLRELKQAGSLFLMCSMQFAVPVKFCINCVVDHIGTVDKYEKLFHAVYHNKTSNETEICKEKYFDQDRLNIVQTLYDEINGLWNKAYCNECFNGSGVINNITHKILNELVIINGCFEKKDPCHVCQSLYINLNDFYIDELEKKYNNKVCFDIQDAMNRTRFLWSKKLHCWDREVNLTAFAAVSTSIACLPILFYIIMYFYTKRVERNHDMLSNDYRTESGENNNTSTVTDDEPNIINTCIPGTSTREAPEMAYNYNENLKTKLKDIKNNSDDDSDDESMIGGTPSESVILSTNKFMNKPTISSKSTKNDNVKNNETNRKNILIPGTSTKEAYEIPSKEKLKTKVKHIENNSDGDSDDESMIGTPDSSNKFTKESNFSSKSKNNDNMENSNPLINL